MSQMLDDTVFKLVNSVIESSLPLAMPSASRCNNDIASKAFKLIEVIVEPKGFSVKVVYEKE